MPTSPLAWVRRRDPTLTSVRRAARVTLVACAGFYPCRYLLDNPTMATYALFGAVAMGVLAQVPGTPGERGRAVLAVLPVGYALVTAGTLLSVSNLSAAAGMFVFGFLISFAGVAGPRLVGLANGVQLLYILPSFPPYDPGSLGYRLAGLTIAVLLLAVAERVLWPDPAPRAYPALLADALTPLAGCLAALADAYDGDAGGRDRAAALMSRATGAAEAIRPTRLAPGQRPASPGRRDRALSHAGGLVRLVLGRAADLCREADRRALDAGAVAALLRQLAAGTRAAAGGLRGEAGPPDGTGVAHALEDFRRGRLRTAPDGIDPDRLRAGSLALGVGEWTEATVTAVRVAGGVAVGPEHAARTDLTGRFWYAGQPAARLWARRLREHLTARSVYFQGALRLAAALTAARLLAGVLDLSHGFWVLLATLTVLRTSAMDTRAALRPALAGTVVGSVVAGALILAGVDPRVYELGLPVVMLAGLTAGPLLGLGWGQALFTLVIALVFAQLSPVNWQLAETRLLDVALGAVVGVLIGLVAWPRGGAGELHRAASRFLAAGAEAVRASAASDPAAALRPELSWARRQGQLADASYTLYRGEGHRDRTVDWEAVLDAGADAAGGADAVLRASPAGRLPPATGPLAAYAGAVADGYGSLATALWDREPAPPDLGPADPGGWPTRGGPDLYHLADLRVWLGGLSAALDRAGRHLTRPE
ncbi:hypothetical protein Psuf_084500 [Phytohabitans suffuscus]|uniref:Integral membrane bound transporter domain-containing protein n=2 Tax=Phytohabitans suffuscus TaxID=624315 RepID=A0A6F8YYB4_9ACTN|nr:hypothetical protein Psuf_084500 [Phytohabitans suffuscus]